MNPLDVASRLTTLLAALGGALKQAADLLDLLPMLRPFHPQLPAAAYENVLLELVWDIRDRSGRTAVLERRQRVRFLREEAEAVRDVVWGEGSQLARYYARGACRMLVRSEGSRRAVLLGLANRPDAGSNAVVTSKRVIEDGFLTSAEYCEVMVERPTQRLVVTVIFPPGRPPKETRLITLPREKQEQRIAIRYAADGRAYLRWSRLKPTIDCTYSLRWSW